MEADRTEMYKKALYWRGLFITRYAAIEYAVAELVSRASAHEAYVKFGVPPFGPAKKLKRLYQLLKAPGPLAVYEGTLEPSLKEFEQYEEHRHFLAHAIMVPVTARLLHFRMYDHREGVYSVGELEFEMKHLVMLSNLIGEISPDFTHLIARICNEIPLPEI